MQETVLSWYALLSGANAALTEPIRDLQGAIGVPLVTALLFGVLGATSPCQLTTNAGALAYVARGAGRRSVASGALAYLSGKVLVYTVLGLVVLLAGQQVAQRSIPLVVAARKVLGPAMLLLGIYLLGWVRLNFTVGQRLSEWVEDRAGSGSRGAFALGVAFALAFCPTLFLLFFGLTIPLALASPVGFLYPGAFAVGTTVPLLGLAALLVTGVGAARGYVQGAKRIDRWVRPAAGVVLLLAGLNDTVTYWLL